MRKISRRDFLKGSAASVAVLSLGMMTGTAFAEEEVVASGEKYTATRTSDGWIKVVNDGGATLGYSENSGISLIEDDGYAFKDFTGSGVLETYEDWRLDVQTRADDLASKLSGEEIAPLLTHGGWSSFGSDIGADEDYLVAGGRAGVTRSAGTEGNEKMAVKWNNALQEYAEGNGGYGIPVTISIDPNNIDDIIDQNSLAATMDTTLANEVAQQHAKAYRAVGVTMLLGPQIDIATQSSWDRSSGTFSEDPALNRDLANAYISGLQSTYDEEGNDLGWGDESVVAIAKHFAGAGASEGGRNDHNDSGKYTVFPGDNFEAHLIPFFDGAFNLDSATEKAGGVMPNYAIAYSEDGSLGDLVGGAYSTFKINLLRDNDYDGFILTDWQVTEDPDGPYGSRAFGDEVEEMTEAERFATLFEIGVDQVGGTTSTDAATEGYSVMVEDLGEDDALAIMREHAARFFVTQMEVGLFENPYLDTETTQATVWTDDVKEYGKQTQAASVVMVKNSGNTISAYDESAEKPTVYIPYAIQQEGNFMTGITTVCKAVFDVDVASQYYNVVTDTVGDPSGTDDDGNATYTEDDIIRASADEIAACDYAIVSISAPYVDGTTDDDDIYYPASMQFEEYTADTAHEAIAYGTEIIEMSDGYYGTTTMEVEEDRSYVGNTAALPDNYSDYELLQYVKGAVSDDCKVILLIGVGSASTMVMSEVEPLADAILVYYTGTSSSMFTAEVMIDLIVGNTEPNGLLIKQMPASMEAVEAQQEDVPRDTECHVDTDGNTYDFAFGMNWSGVIADDRVTTYSAEPLTTVETISYSPAV